ncbi:hypothetical protein BDZ89DRAFT_1075561 [Hymenopellis radicata]|nr:hypothetical protein BDZ89DRAFT_1075561 [Hymenopellis radicata]
MHAYSPFNGPLYGFWEDSSLSMAVGPEAAVSSGYYTEKPGLDPRLYINPWTVNEDVEIADPSIRFVDNEAGEFSLTFVPVSYWYLRGGSDSDSDDFDDDPETIPYLEEKNVWVTVDSFTSYCDPTSDGDIIGNAPGSDTSLTSLRYPLSVNSHQRVGAPSDATQSLSSAPRAESTPTLTRRHSVTGYNHLPNTFSWPAPTYTAAPTTFYDGLESGLNRLRLDEHPDFDPVDDPLPFRDDFPPSQPDIPGSYPTGSQAWSSEQPSTSSAVIMGIAHLPVVGETYLTSYLSAPASSLQGTIFASSSLLHALSPSYMSESMSRSGSQEGDPFLVERARTSTRTRASTQSRKAPKASRGVDAAVVESRRMHPVLFHCSSCKTAGMACDFTSKYSLNRHIDSTHHGFLAFCDYPGCQKTFRHTVSRNRHVARKHLQDHTEIGLTRARQRTRKKLRPEAKARGARLSSKMVGV